MSLSVIIPSRTAANLAPCVAAVREMEPSCDIIVVWDRSRGNDWLAPSPDYRIREVESEFIFARNCNLGIEAAGENDVVLLNDDALLKSPGGFSGMQQQSRNRPEFGVIGAVTNVTGQPLQWQRHLGLREVPHFAFVGVFIPRTTIRKVGLLDERYCIDYGVEDRDYCEAVRRAGLKCGVFDHCYLDHASLTSSFRGDPRASRSYAANWQLFCDKWGVTA